MKLSRKETFDKMSVASVCLSSRGYNEWKDSFIFYEGSLFTLGSSMYCRIPFDAGFVGAVSSAPFLQFLRVSKSDEVEIDFIDGSVVAKDDDIVFSLAVSGIEGCVSVLDDIIEGESSADWRDLSEEFCVGLSMVSSLCSNKEESKFSCVHVCLDCVEACSNVEAGRYFVDVPVDRDFLISGESAKILVKHNPKRLCETSRWVVFDVGEEVRFGCLRRAYQFPDIGGSFQVEGPELKLPEDFEYLLSSLDVKGASIFAQVVLKNNRMEVIGGGGGFNCTVSRVCGWDGPPTDFYVPVKTLGKFVGFDTIVVGSGTVPGTMLKANNGKYELVSVTAVEEE